MEVTPELWDRELSRVLWEEVLENDVESPTGDAEEVACHRLII